MDVSISHDPWAPEHRHKDAAAPEQEKPEQEKPKRPRRAKGDPTPETEEASSDAAD